MPTKTVPWDSSAVLRSDKEIAAYIDAVLEDGDPALLAHALGVVARAKGMADVAKEAGLGRESLYKSLSSDGNTGSHVCPSITIRWRQSLSQFDCSVIKFHFSYYTINIFCICRH